MLSTPRELHLDSVRMVQRETAIALMELQVAPLVQSSSESGKRADILEGCEPETQFPGDDRRIR